MRVRDIMARDVETAAPDESVLSVAQRMEATSLGVFPVVEAERVVGMITDRDITVRVTAGERDPKHCRVREVMTAPVSTCEPDDDVLAVTRTMLSGHVRRLPVLERGRLVGLISIDDLAIFFSECPPAGLAVD